MPEGENFPGLPLHPTTSVGLANAAPGKPRALQTAKAEVEKHGLSLLSASQRGEPNHIHILLLGDRGQRRLVGCSLWGLEDSDTTECLNNHIQEPGGKDSLKM